MHTQSHTSTHTHLQRDYAHLLRDHAQLLHDHAYKTIVSLRVDEMDGEPHEPEAKDEGSSTKTAEEIEKEEQEKEERRRDAQRRAEDMASGNTAAIWHSGVENHCQILHFCS